MEKFKIFNQKMKCTDEKYQIWGDYNSDDGQNLMVVFERCNPKNRDDCESEEVINKWLEFKYIVIQ